MSDVEDRARALLQTAGDSIAVVQPATPLALPRRPRWPVAGAVAAVMVVIVGLGMILRDDTEPADPAGPREVLVPQTLMMTTTQARGVLEELGLEVRSVHGIESDIALECGIPGGRVLGSDPPPQATVPPGSRVDIVTSGLQGDANAYCLGPQRFEDALSMLDLARFRTPVPAFAESVEIWVDGELTRTLNSAEAADPASWGDPSPLKRMLAALDDVRSVNGVPTSPRVWSMIDTGNQVRCGPHDPPDALREKPSTVVMIEHNRESPGSVLTDCHWTRIYRNSEGQVYAIASADHPWPADERPRPTTTAPAVPSAEEVAVAEAFLDFADGGSPPAFAAEVQLLLGNVPAATVDAAAAAERSTWRLPCEGYAERSCPLDALSYVIRRGTVVHGVILRTKSGACHAVGELPEELGTSLSLEHSVSLGVAEPEMCMDNWEVQLWLDEANAIRAVNLILGSP